MKIKEIENKEILDFEKEIFYELVATERAIHAGSPVGLLKWSVQFENSEVMARGCLANIYGNGNTIDEAVKDYCKIVSNCKIAFNAYSDERKEIQFPKLVHTKLLNK